MLLAAALDLTICMRHNANWMPLFATSSQHCVVYSVWIIRYRSSNAGQVMVHVFIGVKLYLLQMSETHWKLCADHKLNAVTTTSLQCGVTCKKHNPHVRPITQKVMKQWCHMGLLRKGWCMQKHARLTSLLNRLGLFDPFLAERGKCKCVHLCFRLWPLKTLMTLKPIHAALIDVAHHNF